MKPGSTVSLCILGRDGGKGRKDERRDNSLQLDGGFLRHWRRESPRPTRPKSLDNTIIPLGPGGVEGNADLIPKYLELGQIDVNGRCLQAAVLSYSKNLSGALSSGLVM